MISLESFIHRTAFAEIVSRWMVNKPLPTDVKQLKTIVNFNSYIARIWVDNLARELAKGLYGKEPFNFTAKKKGVLKDFVVQYPVYSTAHTLRLTDRYKRFPEDFYREAPFDGKVYYTVEQGTPVFIGTTRIKRFRRIAEKGSRRIVDFMLKRIRLHADSLADERAKRLGLRKDQLITPPSMMIDEFRHAERRLIKSIKLGTIQSELPILEIPDVVGIKLIVEKKQFSRLLAVIESHPGCTLIEVEEHRGNYNATNLRLAYDLPRDLILARPPCGKFAQILSKRGFNPDQLYALYHEFLTTGEDQVCLEVIACNFEELLESEIGRSMHEERVLAQRANPDYNSHLATNIRYLMNCMLTLCLAPSSHEYEEVPIKLWVKYMPDTIDNFIRMLYQVPADSSFDVLADEEENAHPIQIGSAAE